MSESDLSIVEMSSGTVLLRVGLLGQVGCFSLGELGELSRGQRVVCRTQRGIEVGVALGFSQESNCSQAFEPTKRTDNDSLAGTEIAGRVLRRTTPEDELLWGHIRQLAEEAYQSCVLWLREQSIAATLIDVEPLLDGRTLYFHFLSEVDEQVHEWLEALLAIYEQRVRESKFARLLEYGCGPGCGTAEAKNGCGSRGGCAVCKVAAACNKH